MKKFKHLLKVKSRRQRKQKILNDQSKKLLKLIVKAKKKSDQKKKLKRNKKLKNKANQIQILNQRKINQRIRNKKRFKVKVIVILKKNRKIKNPRN